MKPAEAYRIGTPMSSEAKSRPYFELIAQLLPFARPKTEQQNVTESYVAVPPALIITDERNDVWTLGFMTAPRAQSPDGEYAFDVLRNGKWCGEIASRIERRAGRVRIFTADGWKKWNGNSFA